MQEILLLNPARRPKKRRANPSRRTHAKNPVRRRVHHKVHALKAHHHRRRRNPITLKGEGIGDMTKNAMLAGAGSVAVDALMGQIRSMLPSSVQTGYGYSAVKAAISVALGIVGKKILGPKAIRMAEGALTVQAANLITGFVPTSMTMAGRARIVGQGGQMKGLGYGTGRSMIHGGAPNRQVALPRNPGLGYFNSSVRNREGVGR